MFERFTVHARRVVVWAQEEARMLNHDYIGTEHFLLGVIHESDGTAAQSLETFGITLEKARSAVENTVGRGHRPASGHIPFTPAAKHTLEQSLREALQLGHDHIGTEHLLLGLIAGGDGDGSKLLASLTESNSDELRRHVLDYLAGQPPESPTS